MNWDKDKLGDHLITLTDYHANGSYKKLKENVTLLDEPDYAVMIRTTNFEKNDFTVDLKYIDEHAYNFLAKSKVYPGDILMNKIANAGSVYLMPNLNKPVSLAMNLFLLRTNPETINQKFIYYYLKCNEEYIKLFAIGAAANTITKENVRNLEIRFPSLPTQRKIASILSAYDDLIENNTRRIKILEEMAQTIYKEWFVNFRFPGYEKVKFVDSPLGKIPEGWEVKKLSELVTTQYGYTESSSEEEIGPKYLRGMDINKTSYINWDEVPFCKIDNDDFKKYKVNIGDIVIIRMADPGKVGIVEKQVDAVFASYLIRLKIIGKVKPYFLFYFLNSEYYQGYIKGASTGTTRKSASAGVMTGIDLVLPDKELINLFEEKIIEFRQQINILLSKNSILRKTRDLLLPKLMSGEVEVSDL